MMDSNPWQVDSIDEFYFLKCPECMFFSQEENDFKGHAIENHPMSNTLFGNLGAKYLVFILSRSLKTREKYISFAKFISFVKEVCLLFNFSMIKFTIMSKKHTPTPWLMLLLVHEKSRVNQKSR